MFLLLISCHYILTWYYLIKDGIIMKLFLQGIILSTLTLTASHANDGDALSTPRGQSISSFEAQTPIKAARPPQVLDIVPPIPCCL